jgi:2-polyprenyl-3-methyl-5-hydroxy-6-metoxy-1,4-benzoquinol methylase
MEVPQDIEKYYPPYYVSFAQEVPALKRQPFLKRMIKNMRMKKKYAQSNAPLLAYLKPTAIMPGQKVLDIGCGKGALICQLFNLGFEQVTGVDKFISQETDYGYGVKVLKKDLSELPSNYYSLLIMHHVLEHVDNQAEQLKECYRLLKKGGALLISLPVVGTALRYIKKTGCR